jgi:hypothetical protein
VQAVFRDTGAVGAQECIGFDGTVAVRNNLCPLAAMFLIPHMPRSPERLTDLLDIPDSLHWLLTTYMCWSQVLPLVWATRGFVVQMTKFERG